MQVGLYHTLDEILEAQPWLPPERLPRAARVADGWRRLAGAHERGVCAHVALGLQAHAAERGPGELSNGAPHAAGQHVVARLLLLKHHPGAPHDVSREG